MKQKSSLFKFSSHGWALMVYCLLLFFFYVGMCNDGTNASGPAIAEKLGLELGVVLNGNAAGGVIGVLIFVIFGQLNRKIGPSLSSGIGAILAGVGYILMGNSPNLTIYTFMYALTIGSIMSAGFISGGTLVARWFPKRKGIVMGYTTMGLNLASAIYVPILLFSINSFGGIDMGVLPIGAACILTGILGIKFIKNTPQERGINPDDVSDEVYAKEYDANHDVTDDGGWTTMKLLKTKELWIVAVTTGIFQICSTGIMTQMVTRNQQLGFTLEQSVGIMSFCAVIGIFGSWYVGVLDERFGPKKTMKYFGLWYMSALMLNATEIMPLVYFSIFMIGMGIGGSANFMTSLPTSVFGRHGFDKVNSVVFPLQGLMSAFCFAINGMVLLVTGSLRYAYIIFGCLALLNSFIISTINEHKYNRDVIAAKESGNASA